MTGCTEGPAATFFRARFGRELRAVEPVPTQLLIEFWLSESPVRNQKLGHAAFSRSSHTGLKNFATGPHGPTFGYGLGLQTPEFLSIVVSIQVQQSATP